MAVFGILQFIPVTRDRFDSVRKTFVSCLTSRTTITIAIGGVLFGIGLTLAGTVSYVAILTLTVSLNHFCTYTVCYCCIRVDLRQSFSYMVGIAHALVREWYKQGSKHYLHVTTCMYQSVGGFIEQYVFIFSVSRYCFCSTWNGSKKCRCVLCRSVVIHCLLESKFTLYWV